MDRSLMAEATSPDDSPTSGYQLSEIARMTKASYDANVQVQKYLVERLAKPNHNTKFKALMIIKHVCRTGRPEFKREMGRNVDAIRECLQFKGPPDPLRGDEIYRRVRECAREVLEALFDGQMPVTTSAVAAANRIQGIGSDFVPPEQPKPSTMAYLSSLANAASTAVRGEADHSPKYTGHPGATSSFGPPGSMGASGGNSGGFGNPNFADARNEKSWLQRAGELASTAASAAGFAKSETSEPLQGAGYGGNGAGFAPRTSGTFSRSAFSNPTGSGSSGGFDREAFRSGANDYNYATNRGPNAIHAHSAPYSPQPPAEAAPSGGFVPEMPVHSSGFGRAGGALATGDYEKGVIDSLCEPGGLRPVPPEDKLQEFLNTASTLNEDIVGNCLLDVLNDESWQSRTKALIVIARLVKQPDCAAHRQWWLDRERLDVVESLQSDAKANVRTQATKTLRTIDPSAPVTAAAAAITPPARKGPPGRIGSFTQGQATLSAAQLDNGSEMGTTITEDGSQAISDSGADVEHSGQPGQGVAEGIPEPAPPAPVPQEMDLLGFDDEEPTPAPRLDGGIPATVLVTPQVPVSPLAHEYSYPGGEPTPQHSTVTADADELFAGMSVGATPTTAPTTTASAMLASPTYIPEPLVGTQEVAAPYSAPVPVPAPVHASAAAAPAPAPAAASVFDFLDSAVSQPAPVPTSAPAPAFAPAQEVDLFGSLTIADHTTHVVPAAAPAQSASQSLSQQAPSSSMATGSTKSLFDDFAGLTLTPTSAASPGQPSPAQPVPQQQPQFQPQHQAHTALTPEQQLLMMQAPPPPGANAQGLYLTRPVGPPGPVPGPGAPYAPYGYPPRGLPPGAHPMMPGMVPMPMAGPRGPMGVPLGAPVPLGVAPRPMGHPGMGQQPPIQLRQGASVIAPGMLSHTAERKVIPDATGAQGSSGFGFMGGAKPSAASGGDSFSFVTDAMRAQKQ